MGWIIINGREYYYESKRRFFLDAGVRMVSNTRKGERHEVPDNSLNAHLGKPGSTDSNRCVNVKQLCKATCTAHPTQRPIFRRAIMRSFALAVVSLGMSFAHARADFLTVMAFSNRTEATISFDDGSGNSGTKDVLLTQWVVDYNNGKQQITFRTFSIDLFHTASLNQTYDVYFENLAPTFDHASRMAYIYENFGLGDLTSNPDQAAAVQISLWDLSLNNHNPTSFQQDSDGSYSSGDPEVFKVLLGSNPDADTIAKLVDTYLKASIGAQTSGEWLNAAAAGSDINRGESVMAVPEPSSLVLSLIALGWLGAFSMGRSRTRLALNTRSASKV
jgi:hypothetical protein